MQAAAHGFERLLCFEEGAESSGAVIAGLSELALKQMSLIGKNRCLKASDPRERFVGFFLRFGRIAYLQSDSGEQEMREDCLSGKRRLIEEGRGRGA